MSRISYKTVLRTKGIKPIPKLSAMRSSLTAIHDHITIDGRVTT